MDVPLREYIESIFREKDKAYDAALKSQKESLELAADVLSHKLEMMNQFRAQVLEERGLYVRREQLDAVIDRLQKLEETDANRGGRLWAVGIGLAIVAALLSTLVTIALRHIGGS